MRWAALLGVLLSHPALAASSVFPLDQTHGSIAFSVTNFGAFSTTGAFPRFAGRLVIDRDHPDAATIDVEADATAVTVPWPDGTAMLRGPDFFDTARFPLIRFISGHVSVLDDAHFRIDGMLEIRGMAHPLILDATLEHREANAADFRVTGTLSRGAYGMTTQQIMISDQVRISISARIELPAQDP